MTNPSLRSSLPSTLDVAPRSPGSRPWPRPHTFPWSRGAAVGTWYILYIHGNLMVSGGKFEEDVFVDVACL